MKIDTGLLNFLVSKVEKKFRQQNGFLVLDVPLHCSPYDIVQKLFEDSYKHGFKLVNVDNRFVTNDKIDRQAVIETLIKKATNKKRKITSNNFDFEHSFRELLYNLNSPLFIFFHLTRSLPSERFDLVDIIDRVITSLTLEQKKHVHILIIDDFTLTNYDYVRTAGRSTRNHLKPWDIGPISSKDFELITNSNLPNNTIAMDIVRRIYQRTGGHIGLLSEVLKQIDFGASDLQLDRMGEVLDEVFKWSSVIESINAFLVSDALGLTTVALKYISPTPRVTFTDPKEIALIQNGILFKNSAVTYSLMPGILSDIVHRISTETQKKRPLGTVMKEVGPAFYESGDFSVNDDDIVILHLSDLHFGEKYPFQLPKRNINESEDVRLLNDTRILTDMISEDLQSIDLYDKINGLIISGDITSKAQSAEFKRAGFFVKDICTKLSIDKTTSLCVVAGNHDINWKPELLDNVESNGVSKDNYFTFLEALGIPVEDASCVEISSESGRKKLRIYGLDSNLVESPRAGGIGYINPKSLKNTEKQINDFDKKSKGQAVNQDFVNWVVTHHHVFPATSAKAVQASEKQVSVLANSSELLNFAINNNIEIILHGHEHEPFVNVARMWAANNSKTFGSVVSIGAGSISSDKDDLGPSGLNQYFIIIRNSEGIILRSRTLAIRGTSFQAHCDLFIPIKKTK